jgi:hypothetical protein
VTISRHNRVCNVAHSIGSETLFKITGTCGQDPIMVLLIAHPSFFLNINFFSCTQHFATFYVSLYDIYTTKKNQSNSSFYPYWVLTYAYGFESVFLWDILGNCVFYQYLMQLSEYKYKLEFELGIIQSRRSGCAILLFLATRYFPCRIR